MEREMPAKVRFRDTRARPATIPIRPVELSNYRFQTNIVGR